MGKKIESHEELLNYIASFAKKDGLSPRSIRPFIFTLTSDQLTSIGRALINHAKEVLRHDEGETLTYDLLSIVYENDFRSGVIDKICELGEQEDLTASCLASLPRYILNDDEERKILRVLKILLEKRIDAIQEPSLLKLCNSTMDRVDATKLGFLNEIIARRLVPLAQNPYATHMLEKFIMKNAHNERIIGEVIEVVQSNLQDFYLHARSREVIRYILKYCPQKASQGVVTKILENVLEIAVDRNSYLLIKDCLSLNDDVRSAVISRLINPEKMNVLLITKYGNRVLLHALTIANYTEYLTLYENIKSAIKTINHDKFRAKWQNFIMRFKEKPIAFPKTRKPTRGFMKSYSLNA
eukprot:TRINITY_DN13073_c0_g1_i1.p1 TRINITY_DN13073_c0_g1~~TRINITY_DN13073_c0_g1_i1.p1  ORF type:complete len:354 (+),score=62.46 TRINITY_DN13073_c0_g1_i1:100-1161(+)